MEQSMHMLYAYSGANAVFAVYNLPSETANAFKQIDLMIRFLLIRIWNKRDIEFEL